jgi:hypothetical protein
LTSTSINVSELWYRCCFITVACGGACLQIVKFIGTLIETQRAANDIWSFDYRLQVLPVRKTMARE